MSKFLSTITVAALAIGLSLSFALPSVAFDHHGDQGSDNGAAFAAGTLGFMAGAAAANGGYDQGGDGDYYDHPHHNRWRHIQACEDAYGWRYNPNTDLVQGRHHRVFYCDL